MSEFFKDVIFKDMVETEEGWLALAMEPMVFAPNEHISQIDEVNEFNFEDIKSIIDEEYRSIYKLKLIQAAVNRANLDMSSRDMSLVKDLFVIEFPEDIILDFDNQVMSDNITLRKIKPQFDDDDIRKLMVSDSSSKLNYMNAKADQIGRQNEILDLLGKLDKSTRNGRSAKNKNYEIGKRWREILSNDDWKLRDYDLVMKATRWICEYIIGGNLAALANFTKLKCMTHKNNPIYSMDEIK